MDDAINLARVKSFAWGVNDCCLMAADIVKAITGVDIAADYRGTYSNEAEAEAILVAAGGMAALIHSAVAPLGWTRTRVTLARRGDLVLRIVPETGKPSLGVCLGRDAIFPAIGGGVGFVLTTSCETAWRVE